MKPKYFYLVILFFSVFLIFSVDSSQAQTPPPMGRIPEGMPPMAQMPQFQGMKMGVMDGVLFEEDASGRKKPIASQPVAIIVFQNGQRILMLNKDTDEKGHFQFKNIFKDPSFTYALGTMIGEKLYVMQGLSLKDGQDKIEVQFQVGTGSPHLVTDLPEGQVQASTPPSGGMGGMMGAATGQGGEFTVSSLWEHAHQKVALILTLAVIVSGLVLFIQKKKEA